MPWSHLPRDAEVVGPETEVGLLVMVWPGTNPDQIASELMLTGPSGEPIELGTASVFPTDPHFVFVVAKPVQPLPPGAYTSGGARLMLQHQMSLSSKKRPAES